MDTASAIDTSAWHPAPVSISVGGGVLEVLGHAMCHVDHPR